MTAAAALLHYGGLGLCVWSLVLRFALDEEFPAGAMKVGIVLGIAATIAANAFMI